LAAVPQEGAFAPSVEDGALGLDLRTPRRCTSALEGGSRAGGPVVEQDNRGGDLFENVHIYDLGALERMVAVFEARGTPLPKRSRLWYLARMNTASQDSSSSTRARRRASLTGGIVLSALTLALASQILGCGCCQPAPAAVERPAPLPPPPPPPPPQRRGGWARAL